MNDNSKLASIIVIEGILENTSPFVIGTGKGDIIDIEIIKDENGNPYIPATSFVGALRHHISKNFKEEDKETWEYFWGSKNLNNNKAVQSHFILSDLKILKIMDNPKEDLITVRDGVAIDEKTGTAKEKAKYDYEIVNKDLEFEFKAEIKIRKSFKNKTNDILKILKTIITEFEAGNVQFGAFTTKGFGRFKLKNFQILKFDFPNDGINYLKFLQNEYLPEDKLDLKKIELDLSKIDILSKKDNADCIITADFSIKSSLIISSYTTDSKDPDKVHIKYNGKNVLTGTSLKGAIRSRAFKIVNTLCKNNQEENDDLKKLFGWADTENKEETKYKSRVIIDESIVENVIEKEQARIKIDRFTGGVIAGALFQSKPLWHNDENVRLKIKIKDAKDWEIGLLLLVLKDLWNEDLPIGGEKNIGRGVLKGKGIEIEYNVEKYTIQKSEDDKRTNKVLVNDKDKEKLENFVKEFLKKARDWDAK
ncbi:CRISPR/Cas system CSM-associated protein Csm3, group 7 of RAMP superfamily [Thermoanaerobacter uzonensis DSM 18761]|uniref:CRISPR/Cas system CSM-associated protein Csm3, group 7 of RAMP superfamily n=1 Tax=Thermoanaerobacter uzonensis DSM 18761 TaxID=1123369 RepID=A0A1M5AAH7_9THEO|nr:RAMP superfamily CRISPR-associated protein [Thermoanaerobacter uzonensis]SHF27185.1 CRISPR/Cas system CSM-associated protein Csm3, group 7 of RAMP superfamily [Thermoanaerobacter uzonensis DSM 18761]